MQKGGSDGAVGSRSLCQQIAESWWVSVLLALWPGSQPWSVSLDVFQQSGDAIHKGAAHLLQTTLLHTQPAAVRLPDRKTDTLTDTPRWDISQPARHPTPNNNNNNNNNNKSLPLALTWNNEERERERDNIL